MIKKEDIHTGTLVIVNSKTPKNGSYFDNKVGLRFFGDIPHTSDVLNDNLIPPGEQLMIYELPKKKSGINLISFVYKNKYIVESFWIDFKFRTDLI